MLVQGQRFGRWRPSSDTSPGGATRSGPVAAPMSQLPPHDSVHCHAAFQTLQCRHATGASEPAVPDRRGAENSSGTQGPPHKGEGSTGRQDGVLSLAGGSRCSQRCRAARRPRSLVLDLALAQVCRPRYNSSFANVSTLFQSQDLFKACKCRPIYIRPTTTQLPWPANTSPRLIRG